MSKSTKEFIFEDISYHGTTPSDGRLFMKKRAIRRAVSRYFTSPVRRYTVREMRVKVKRSKGRQATSTYYWRTRKFPKPDHGSRCCCQSIPEPFVSGQRAQCSNHSREHAMYHLEENELEAANTRKEGSRNGTC